MPWRDLCASATSAARSQNSTLVSALSYIIPIALQEREDDAEAMRDMARFARRVRRRLGLTQARCIDIPRETIRNWEQAKRGPTGTAGPCSGYSTGRRKPPCGS